VVKRGVERRTEHGPASRGPDHPRRALLGNRRVGFAPDEVAAALKVSAAVMADWLAGQALPSLTQFRRLAHVLRRSTATFFLPTPPQAAGRSWPSARRRGQRHVRYDPRSACAFGRSRAFRRPWPGWSALLAGARRPAASSRWLRCRGRRVCPARVCRRVFRSQAAWRSDSDAFRAWREAFENARVSVFALSMGEDAARGFSVGMMRRRW